jgi:hypothetical protein
MKIQLPLTPTHSRRKPTHDEIAGLAYKLYLQNGKREGHADDDWLQAEAILMRQAEAEANKAATLIALEGEQVRPLAPREHQFARDARGSASREEIRQKATPLRPAARQPQWRTARPARTNQIAGQGSR